ncbi:MAG TPA: response regulator [Actinomycetota bacterium]|nr:response regulator [Actinomycetota bacterium]
MAPSPSDDPTAGSPDSRLSVLIVDDDPEIRLLLENLLDLEGFHVAGQAADGYAAVYKALELQPDIIVLDYMMPRIDGAESAKFLRAVTPYSMIIAFSGIVHEKPEWADDFISKAGIDGLADMARYLTRNKGAGTQQDRIVTV